MNQIPAFAGKIIAPMSVDAINNVRALERDVRQLPQVEIRTHHLFHAGMYSRTVMIPAGVVITGALIKRATILIVNGDVTVTVGLDRNVRLHGYHVVAASAHRKQAFMAHADTHLTMLFPTAAKDVQDAEGEFTDEADLLFSRGGENIVNITGE